MVAMVFSEINHALRTLTKALLIMATPSSNQEESDVDEDTCVKDAIIELTFRSHVDLLGNSGCRAEL